MATDTFGKRIQSTVQGVTADNAVINWGGVMVSAVNIQIGYQRGTNHYRSVGGARAVIVTTMPTGSISMGRVVTEDAAELFTRPGWDGCIPGEITLTLNGCTGSTVDAAGNATQLNPGTVLKFTAVGCMVNSYSISTEGEGLMVMDNVAISFLQLIRS